MIRDIFWQEAYTEESGYTKDNPDYNIETSAPFTDASIAKVIGLVLIRIGGIQELIMRL